MFAKRRTLSLNGQELERTPLLIPSFSSKGFPDICKIIEYSSELIDGATLVSAYDLHYEKNMPSLDFPSMIFLDSGGYEASKDHELSDYGDKDHVPKAWTQEMHEEQLKNWAPSVPSVVISYDHPEERTSIQNQIERAHRMAPKSNNTLREILLKPTSKSRTLLKISEILDHVGGLAKFDIIGVTEKEIGNSIFERMKNIAKIRRALDGIGANTPIHVFGSLDTVTTPMYFLAGSDIFDGLTWLRFAYYKGQTIYKQNYGALKLGVSTKAHVIDGRCWNDNYYYIREMELQMRRYLNDHDAEVFEFHSDLFEAALENVKEAVGA